MIRVKRVVFTLCGDGNRNWSCFVNTAVLIQRDKTMNSLSSCPIIAPTERHFILPCSTNSNGSSRLESQGLFAHILPSSVSYSDVTIPSLYSRSRVGRTRPPEEARYRTPGSPVSWITARKQPLPIQCDQKHPVCRLPCRRVPGPWMRSDGGR